MSNAADLTILSANLLTKLQNDLLMISPNDVFTWPLWFTIVFSVVITVGMTALSWIINMLFYSSGRIPVKGKHLDNLEPLDILFISINKFLTVIFVFHVVQMTYATPTVKWSLDDLTLANTLGSFVAFYFFYDLLYALFHRFLHLRAIYPLIHKHHHR
jgi:sterol desaturase/sphingolipid hydroxylase (fatty acid hydroxylase superfamily)